MQGDERWGRGAGPVSNIRLLGTHTHTPPHTQRPAPTGGHGNIREGPGIQEPFQSFLSWSICWEGLGQGHWSLSSGHIKPKWLWWQPPASETCSPCPRSHHLPSWSQSAFLLRMLQRSKCPGSQGTLLLTSYWAEDTWARSLKSHNKPLRRQPPSFRTAGSATVRNHNTNPGKEKRGLPSYIIFLDKVVQNPQCKLPGGWGLDNTVLIDGMGFSRGRSQAAVG